MAKSGTPINLRGISQVTTEAFESGSTKKLETVLQKMANKGNIEDIQQYFSELEKVFKTEKERYEVYKKLEALTKTNIKNNDVLLKQIQKKKKVEEDTLKNQNLLNNAYKDAGKALDSLIKKNKEIYQISHDMQLQGNITWKQYTELYNQAYETARKLNTEMGKQLVTAGEMVKAQETMIQSGWRNIDTNTLTTLSAQATLLTRVLGSFPIELQTAFQMSYRQFGSQTERFMKGITNQLNTFSNTFGMTVQTLTQTVSTMMASNTFLARNNMTTQLNANQSLMQAAALATQMGLASPAFITRLAGISQFGTASQMSELYQAGAYLQDFSTADFQSMMIDQDYEGATSSLISSIYNTLGNMEAGYLRNEYMARIGEGFGLSQDDLLQIMTNGNNLAAYTADIQDKLLKVNTSVEDELKDLRMTLVQQIENFWTNTNTSQFIGSFLQETGLYDISGLLKTSNFLLALNLKGAGGQTFSQGLLGMFKGGAGGAAGAGGTSGLSLGAGKLLGAGAGAALGIATNVAGHNMIADPNKSAAGGWLHNTLGGAAGGAITGLALSGGNPLGALIGGALGAGAGLINSFAAEKERKSALEDIEDRRILAARDRHIISTGNPVVDAINNMNQNLTNVIKDEGSENRVAQATISFSQNLKI